jgi:hypothetical protein
MSTDGSVGSRRTTVSVIQLRRLPAPKARSRYTWRSDCWVDRRFPTWGYPMIRKTVLATSAAALLVVAPILAAPAHANPVGPNASCVGVIAAAIGGWGQVVQELPPPRSGFGTALHPLAKTKC